jgi:hypothetical protein
MKNIHVLPTYKSSRLFYSGTNKDLLFSKEPIRSPQHIYITSDEEQEQGYSEEKLLTIVDDYNDWLFKNNYPNVTFKEWFKQFENK